MFDTEKVSGVVKRGGVFKTTLRFVFLIVCDVLFEATNQAVEYCDIYISICITSHVQCCFYACLFV